MCGGGSLSACKRGSCEPAFLPARVTVDGAAGVPTAARDRCGLSDLERLRIVTFLKRFETRRNSGTKLLASAGRPPLSIVNGSASGSGSGDDDESGVRSGVEAAISSRASLSGTCVFFEEGYGREREAECVRMPLGSRRGVDVARERGVCAASGQRVCDSPSYLHQ
jgi:hypothetical protein